ncbi:LysR family transcriptional regulator [Hydrogenophaga sp. OTU3427]|uniref:LysR family transcriptional regulator n=1 Tax=Hydrogenophaga sp. OTU3427 TaxID=3043856 RepID=UPI00313E4FE3
MRRKIPSTQALQCFESAARHQSYTRAAQELALTQSAVSRQIAQLESFLNVQLFQRTRHGVLLTPSGAEYAQQVARRLDALERDTLDAMARFGQSRAVHLAAVPTFATRWLMPRLPVLARQHPEIVVHIETSTRPFLFADTERDAALYAGTPEQVANWAGTQAAELLPEVVVPVCGPALLAGRSKLQAADVAQLPLLQQSTRPDAWRQWFEANGVEAPLALAGPRHELFSLTATAAAHGLGVALVPRLLVEDELARGDLVVACDRPLASGRRYWFVTPERAEEPVAVTLLRDWLVAAAQAAATP